MVQKSLNRYELAELSVASLILTCRVWSISGSGVWRDWVSLLCIFWILHVVSSQSRVWSAVMAAVMALLAAIYIWGQFPLSLRALGVDL